MDRRYNQARFYNGTPATARSSNRSDSLVRSYLAKARKANTQAQSYGGSTGGRSSIDNQYESGRISSMSRGSFLILGLDVWRNVSLNEMRRYGPKF